jgi:hypothetical protein
MLAIFGIILFAAVAIGIVLVAKFNAYSNRIW